MAARLTAKAQRFCEEYLVDYDPQRAAERAGYAKGDAARGNAHRNLKDRRVIDLISEIKQEKLPAMGRKFLLAELYEIITDRRIAPQVRVNAIEKASRVQHLYERDEAVPGEVHVHLNTHIPVEHDGQTRHSDPAEQVAKPPAESE